MGREEGKRQVHTTLCVALPVLLVFQGCAIPGSIETVIATGARVDVPNGVFGSLRLRYFGSRRLLRIIAWAPRRRVHTVEALQSVVAPFARLDRIASTARTRNAIGPAQLSQVIGSFLVILQVRYQVFHRVAPTGFE
jgi:hypothetical protein